MKLSWNILWEEGPRALMILVFGFSLYAKAEDSTAFFQIIEALKIMPLVGKFLLSVILSMEFTAIIFLLLKPQKGILLSIAILIFFTITILFLYLNGIHESCACFGNLVASKIGPIKMIQNIGLILILGASWYLKNNQEVD